VWALVRNRVDLAAEGKSAEAEEHLRQALDWAPRQGALCWELRAATSLACLRGDQNRSTGEIALFGPIYNRFTEGFATVTSNPQRH
jgi:predicted ATPase